MNKDVIVYKLLFEVKDVLAVKILNGEGFIVTVYQTRIYKQKGELLWPKQNN